MRQLNLKVTAAAFAQLLLLVCLYGDYSAAQWAIHKVLLLAATVWLLVLAYQAFRWRRPVLGLLAALAAFPGFAFALFFVLMLGKR